MRRSPLVPSLVPALVIVLSGLAGVGGVGGMGRVPAGAATPAPVVHHGDNPSAAPAATIAATPSGLGYWTTDVLGGVFTHGDARFFGSVPGLRAAGHRVGSASTVDLAPTPSGTGYWVLDAEGGIFGFGDARFFGSVPGLREAGHQVGPGRLAALAPSSTGDGYLLADEHGGVFAFGDARFHGSLPALRAAGVPVGAAGIVALAAHPGGSGYWIVDRRGGVFAFGGAPFHGSLPERGVIAEAVGFGATPGGGGYWIATADGGVHAFGAADFPGSAARMTGGSRAVDLAASPRGTGVWILAADGTVFARAPAPPFEASVAAVTASDLPSSWRPGCPVGPEQLRTITAPHFGFDGAVRSGRIVVHADQVTAVLGILRDLYDVRFAIERMEPVDAYGGDDDASMAANNTSGFNCRRVAGSSSWSQHAFGRAIDLNPVQNPYVQGSSVEPPAGRSHLDRRSPAPGKVRAGDAAVHAFAARGWGWGGDWRTSKDYQHFSATGS